MFSAFSIKKSAKSGDHYLASSSWDTLPSLYLTFPAN
ncbi:hypothetical protein SLEP1_g28672 [Rubroshorea leprosula]|uniref:Uncharacterized protein n=1 Tax=Rubroshorea leprosula TaxID=152421 RepID=A0AAV5JX19_9ROSI|nr:hypothetical protein SLEP1_g28672 [Rubroshorea leprosula]